MCIIGGYGKCEVRNSSSPRRKHSSHCYATTVLGHPGFLINLTGNDCILHRKSILVMKRYVRQHFLSLTMPFLLDYGNRAFVESAALETNRPHRAAVHEDHSKTKRPRTASSKVKNI